MPLITSFQLMEKNSGALHPSQVIGHYKVFGGDGHGPIFQLDTRGRDDRVKKDGQSQTFQLDRSAAEELWKLLGQTYGFK